MNRTENSDQDESKRASIPRWLAILIALVFWIIGIPLFYGVAPWAISLLTPRYGWVADHASPWNLIGLIPVVFAAACLVWIMVLHFAQAPTMPESVELELTPNYLLRRGPYAFSRHPMYLSELALLLGWTIFYGSIVVLLAFAVASAFFNLVHVPREERALEARFGDAYREYKRIVPRWFGKVRS